MRKLARLFVVSVVALAALPLFAQAQTGDNPFTPGSNWVLDAKASSGDPIMKSDQFRIIRDTPKEVHFTYRTVYADNRAESGSWIGKPDGKPVAARGVKGEMVASNADGSMVWTWSDGSKLESGAPTMSDNNRTATYQMTWTSKDGKVAKGTSVYKRTN